MIRLYSGTPGSGKSLHTAKDIRDRLRTSKCVIIGNFFVNTKKIPKCKGTYIYVTNDRLTPGRLLRFARHYAYHLGRRLKEGELWLLIDEAQLLFNSREWQNIGRQGWLSFFSQHRHYGYDVVLAAQFDRMLDRQVRGLIEYETIHRKVSRAGKIGFVVGLLFRNQLYIAVEQWYPLKEKVGSDFFVGHKGLFDIYDSYNHFDGFDEFVKKATTVAKKQRGQTTNGFKGLDSLRAGQRTGEDGNAGTGDVPGSIPEVVPNETENNQEPELRPDRVHV